MQTENMSKGHQAILQAFLGSFGRDPRPGEIESALTFLQLFLDILKAHSQGLPATWWLHYLVSRPPADIIRILDGSIRIREAGPLSAAQYYE